MMLRLPQQENEIINRSIELEFTWNGKPYTGYEGDTIASALAASGVDIFSRSMKYHRPRGIMTANHWDPGLAVQVDDEPNVRSGSRRLEANTTVSAQNVWPSLEHDLGTLNKVVGRFISSGFYYKTFMRPRFFWNHVYQRVLRKFAPGGKIHWQTPSTSTYDKRYVHPDVLVAGGGPSGMSAAISAANEGASVLLVEMESDLGGHLRWGDTSEISNMKSLIKVIEDNENIEVLTDSTVTGRYDHNWVSVMQRSHSIARERLIKARVGTLVVAPGLIERPYIFKGNDIPGVMLSGAARRLINLWAVKPGQRAVVFTANPEGDSAIGDLQKAGVEIAEVVDARKGQRIVAVTGKNHVKSVELSDGRSIDADLVVVAAGWTAPTSLLNMAGDKPEYDQKAARYFPKKLPDDVLATGGIVGNGDFNAICKHGSETGRIAANRALKLRHQRQTFTAWARNPDTPSPERIKDLRDSLIREEHPECYFSTDQGFVDFSEDVKYSDLVQATQEGFDSIELMKRYTTATMGPAQGKLETVNAAAVLANSLGTPLAEIGTTIWRPPFAPITLGALAGRIFEPTRRSALQDWHEENGAVPLLAGQWVRPDHYGDANAEALNVRNNVGIIDVTPLGKIELQGTDVSKLLDQVYTNRWESLSIGKVRYGVMVGEDGVISDDGVTGRLDDDRWLMTTTSSGAGAVWEKLEDWLQNTSNDWDVCITPVTGGLTSINVAGPNSRSLLEKLVNDVDLSSESFPYFSVREGTVAEVENCIIWRIGFTGELSYEIHVPSGYSLHVWESLLLAGQDLGCAPFGVEAQRILRLEKGHFIVGQDTDGLTKAPTAGLSNLVKLDKDDMVGLPELADSFTNDRLPVLVAVQTDDPLVVPEEAAQILNGNSNEILGRITSSRMSPTLKRSICLAQVSPEISQPDSKITILLATGERVPATVLSGHAHFDPSGSRQNV